MADRDVKILLKTIADMSGATRLGRWMHKHSATVRKLKTAYGQLSTAAGAVAKIGASAFRKLGTAAVGATAAIGGAVREATSFNVVMARAWTMMPGGIGQFKEMRAAVKELSGEFGLAKDELAKGLYQTLSAGVPQENALTFLSTAAKVAIADGSDVSTAVDGITTVLNAFGMEADQAGRVADQMFNTVKNGKTTFAQLAASLSGVASQAASSGVPFEHVLASIATLTKQGTPTSQAVTQISAAMSSMNRVLGDGWSNSMSFQEGLEAVAEKADGAQSVLLKLLGREEAVQAVMKLTGAKARGAAEDIEATAKAAGSLQEAFDKVQGFRHWDTLWQRILGSVDAVGQVFDNVLAPVADRITEQLKSWNGNAPFFEGLEDRLVAIRDMIEGIWGYVTNVEGGAAEVWGHIKGVIIGAWQEAVENALAFLMENAPKLGAMIGDAFHDAAFNLAKRHAQRREAEDEVGKRHGMGGREVQAKAIFDKALRAEVDGEVAKRKASELHAKGQLGASGIERKGKAKREFHEGELERIGEHGRKHFGFVGPPEPPGIRNQQEQPAPPTIKPPTIPPRILAEAKRKQLDGMLEQFKPALKGALDARENRSEALSALQNFQRTRSDGRSTFNRNSFSYKKRDRELQQAARAADDAAVAADSALSDIGSAITTMAKNQGQFDKVVGKLKTIAKQVDAIRNQERNSPGG